MSGKRLMKKSKRKRIGFTNLLAIFLLLFLVAGLAGGFYLAVLSIKYQYTGALACWTIVFTPIGTMIGIVMNSIVNKSKAENSGPNGEGIKFAAAQAAGFVETDETSSTASPGI